MATQTENLGLRKPAPEDLVNVTTDISDNMDLIDAAIEGKAVAEHSHGGGEAEGAVEAHRTDTTDVHGISDTSTLALVGHEHAGVYAPAAAVATHSADTTDVHGIPDTSLLVDNADLVAHNEDTTAVHGIANTALLITTADHALIDHDDIPGSTSIPVQDEPPDTPDLHDLWVDSDEPAISGGGGGAAIAYQPEAPDNPAEGDLWADSDETTPSGNSLAAILPLDIAPVTPHAKDDEFSGSSLDVKWTIPITSAAGGATTATVSNGWVTLESSAAGTGVVGQVIGIRQNCPTGSFTVSAKITTSRPDFAAASPIHGIFVARRTATAKGHTLGVQPGVEREVEYMGVTTYSETAQWSDWDGLEANIAGYAWTTRWLRFTWDAAASTLYSYFSSNGVGWQRLTSRTSMAQPEVMGIMMYERVGSVGADQRVHADWFRVTEP